jgi:putative transcriptional regulator
MSDLKAGFIIKSTDELIGSIFEHTTILIAIHNNEGTIGFVTNKPLHKSLHDLIEFKRSKPHPIMYGGPVDKDHLFVVHNRPDLITDGEKIYSGYYLGGNMEEVIEAINNNGANGQDIKLFIGYCGWDLGQLEAEIEEGSWVVDLS